MAKKILFIDDEPYFVRALIEALEDEGYVVEQAHNGSEAIEKLRHSEYDLIMLDIIMPTGDSISDPCGGTRTGIRDLEIMRGELVNKLPMICVTVVDDPDVHDEIRQIEIHHEIQKSTILVKPVMPSELIEQVKEYIGDP